MVNESQQLIHRLLEERYRSKVGFLHINNSLFEVFTIIGGDNIAVVNGNIINGWIVPIEEHNVLCYRDHCVIDLYGKEFLYNMDGVKLCEINEYASWVSYNYKDIDKLLKEIYSDGLQSS